MTQPVAGLASRWLRFAVGAAWVFVTLLAVAGCGKKEEGIAKAAAAVPARQGDAAASQACPGDAVGSPTTTQTTRPEGGPQSPGKEEGKWVAVVRETLRQYTPAVGNLRARQTTRVSSQVSGRVESVLVDVGDVVKKGQTLVRLDPTFFEIEVAQIKAGLEAARASLALAEIDVRQTEREMKRQRNLLEKEAATPKEIDDATDAYNRAVAGRNVRKSMVTETEKRLAYSEERLKESKVPAPYDSVVTRRMIDPGEYVATMPPTALVEVQEVGALYLEFSLPQELLSTVKTGTTVEYEVEGVKDSNGTGQVAVIFPAIDELTRSFRCRVVVESKDLKLRPGLLARVRVAQTTVKDALVVPRAALSQSASSWQVYVSNSGHAVARPVKIGLVTEDKAQILSGLQAGERVLVPEEGILDGTRPLE